MAPSRALRQLSQSFRHTNVRPAACPHRHQRVTAQSLSGDLSIRTPCGIPQSSLLSLRRPYSTAPALQPPDFLSEGELKIFEKLRERLEPTKLEVQDVSGGCGSMYALDIVSPKFAGLPIVKQHRLVNEVLGSDIKTWHGLQIRTKAP